MDNAVAIAALGVTATVVGCLVWVVRYLMKEFNRSIVGVQASLESHVKAANNIAKATEKLTKATDKGTEASQNASSASLEALQFMRNLNGKLAKATIQTVQEQKVKHQTVEHHEDVGV